MSGVMAMDGDWYLAHVPREREALAARVAAAAGCDVFLPIRRRKRCVRGGVPVRAEAVGVAFPGYLFVRCANPAALARDLMIPSGECDAQTGQEARRWQRAVHGWMQNAKGGPRVVPARVMARLREAEESGAFDIEGWAHRRGGRLVPVCKNQRVRLPSNLEAVVLSVEAGGVAAVETRLFGRDVTSRVPVEALEPLERVEDVLARAQA